MMRPEQIRLKPEVAAQLGPMGRVRKKRQIALHANLMAAANKAQPLPSYSKYGKGAGE